jgi:hypothetical protein
MLANAATRVHIVGQLPASRMNEIFALGNRFKLSLPAFKFFRKRFGGPSRHMPHPNCQHYSKVRSVTDANA